MKIFFNFLLVEDDLDFAKKLFMLIESLFDKSEYDYKPNILSSDFKNMNHYKSADVIFMDIELDKDNGIEIANNIKLANPNTIIIFITNNSHLVYDSFIANPLYFIRKNNLDRDLNAALISLKNHLKNYTAKIKIRENGREIIIPQKSIVYIEAMLHKVKVATLDNQYICNTSFKNFMSKLNCIEFCQIQRSYIINVRCIKYTKKNIVVLINEQRLTIGKKFKKDFFSKYFEFINRDF